MTLTARTATMHRAAGRTAMRKGESRDPDTNPFVQRALCSVPPGHRENGETATAIRTAWLLGYDREMERQSERWVAVVDGRVQTDAGEHADAERYAAAARRVQPGAAVEVLSVAEFIARRRCVA